jgi:hypothetical protein
LTLLVKEKLGLNNFKKILDLLKKKEGFLSLRASRKGGVAISLRLLRRFAPRNDNQASCHCKPAFGGRGNLGSRTCRFVNCVGESQSRFPTLWVGKCVSEANLVSDSVGFESELAKPISILRESRKKEIASYRL